MSTKNETAGKSSELKLTLSRVVNAPCEMVYRAWSEPEQLAQWFCPQEAECKSVTADVCIGGAFRIHMLSPKGDHIAVGKYLEVIPSKRLRFTWQWEHYAMPESVVTVEFEDLDKTTRVTLTHTGLPDQEDVAEHTHGWTSLMDKFVGLVKEKKIIA
ncbi:MAG TPA: SRPBCC domain-containing protein [Verrucomicrobiae bacterium]|jgi:uncharacterized protein YndB with AHSA1/START domain